jgi:DNA-binding SARP family transcriptional activator/tetratricopeptide (TPR) repeat protein/TolB-like protein
MPIRLQTLGGLRGQLDGEELGWIASKSHPAALLVYLALERCATRDVLQALLWPEGDTGNAGHRLRNTVYELRQSLGDGSIETRGRELRASGTIQADALEFERAVELGQCAAAIDLYRGSFLSGVHLAPSTQLESWIDARRLRYARLFRKASRALVQEKIEARDLAGALTAARAWVVPDPLDDEAQHQLIEVLIRCGEHAEARTHFESYSRLLSRDDLEPLSETRALIEGLDRDSLAIRVRADAPRSEETPSLTTTQPAGPAGTHLPIRQRKTGWFSWATVLVVAGGLASTAWQLGRSEPVLDPRRLAVLPLVNQTGADSLDAFGALATMVLTDGLSRTNLVQVAPTASVLAASAAHRHAESPDLVAMARETGAGLIVQGAYFLSGDSLVIQPQIVDVGTNQVAFPVERVTVPAADDLLAIQMLLERVLITLSSRLDERLTGLARGAMLVDLPMSLEAYREFALGLEKFWEWNFDRRPLPHFARAVQLDSTSATALLWNVWSDWFENANLPRVDSLLHRVGQKQGDLSSYDLAVFEWLKAWVEGDLSRAHRASVRWSEIGGGIAHTEAAYDAFRLNRLDEARRRIQDALAIPSNRRFAPTWQVAVMIDHVRGLHTRELRTARTAQQHLGGPGLMQIRSLAALGEVGEVRSRLERLKSTTPRSFYFRDAAAEFRWHGYADAANEIGRLAVGWYREALAAVKEDQPLQHAQSTRYLTLRLAGTLFDLGEFDEARALYEAMAAEPMPAGYSYDYYFAYDLEPLGYLGIDAAQRGDRARAETFIRRLGSVDRPYLLGNDQHWQARIAAALGQCERAVTLLEAALRDGAAYWQWGGFPLLREVPQFSSLRCSAIERFMAFRN